MEIVDSDFLIIYSSYSSAAKFILQGVGESVASVKELSFKKDILSKILFKIFVKIHFFRMAAFFRISQELRRSLKEKKWRKILFFDCSSLDEYFVFNKLIKKNVQKYIYYWNPIQYWENDKKKSFKVIEKLKRKDFCLKTFDIIDAETYSIQFLKSPNRNITNLKKTIQYDFYFLGLPKGREKTLLTLKKALNKKGFTTNFLIISNKEQFISQEENRQNEANSMCIVDIISTDYAQNGLTLRPTAALFLKKKIITNCKFVLKADFYNSANIFFTEDLSLEGIEEFMNMPYEDISDEIVDSYEINNWIKNNF
jgi:hypothetical protein